MPRREGFDVRPLTPARWADLERLFGPSGAYSGCWCMFWRVSRKEFSENGNAGNRWAMRRLVRQGNVTGLIGYVDGEPAGWISIDRRERYVSLERSRVLKRVDDRPVWSIVCFFIGKEHRGRGLMGKLLRAGLDHARDRGATMVEAYPPSEWRDPASNYMGLRSEFEKAGFREVPGNPRIMRRGLRPKRGKAPAQPARASQKASKAST